MAEEQKKEWAERWQLLRGVGEILSSYQFDGNGLCVNFGKHERCTMAAIYYAGAADAGEGESLWAPEGGTVHTIFQPTPLERAVLGLTDGEGTPVYYDSYNDSQGFVFGKELLADQVAALRAKAHSDNPDDEIEEGHEDATPVGDEIKF